MDKEQPNWQDISLLPIFSEQIDNVHKTTKEIIQSLVQAVNRPYSLDDETVNQVVTQYSEQQALSGLFESQFTRWDETGLSQDERKEVERLASILSFIKTNTGEVLTLANYLRGSTIESLSSMGDSQLAIDVLTSETELPG